MSLINVKDIRKVYRVDEEKIVALGRINLRIEQGEICCILGTSGSGKSTLLNIMAGLEKPTKGKVLVSDQSLLRAKTSPSLQKSNGHCSASETSALCSSLTI